MELSKKGHKVAVLGAGPSGLMAAWELQKAGFSVTVLEADERVGGLAATHVFEGKGGTYRFDFGGHRFITHNPELLAFIEELMEDDLLHSIRSSVIRYRDRTYDYPLALGNILKNAPWSLLTGVAKDLLFVLPFTKAVDDRESASFADWIESRFGSTLYRHFFEGYTGKLWGIDPKDLSADWAAQRISLIDLKEVARRLLPRSANTPRTYARSYRYPKYGFGAIFDRLKDRLEANGATVLLNAPVTGVKTEKGQIKSVSFQQQGQVMELDTDYVVSTLPMPLMMSFLGEQSELKFRALRFLNMPMDMENISTNTWQYLSDPDILATRLQEPRRRSPFMAPDGKTSMMLEIPCWKGDEIWSMDDHRLFERAKQDMNRLGVNMNKATGECFSSYAEFAYPLMNKGYQSERNKNAQCLNQYDNLVMCGRQGTFRYIFTDTAMEMGQLAARSLIDQQDYRKRIFEFRNEKTVIETQSVA